MSSTELTKKRILFVLPSLISGGAQRTVLNILNHMDLKRFDPCLVLFEKKGELLAKLKKEIKIHELKSLSARRAILPLRNFIRDFHPALVFATIRYINAVTVLATRLSGRAVPVVVRETNHFTAAGISASGFFERMVGLSYRKADRVIALSEGVRQDVIQRHQVNPDRVMTIYNPLDVEEIQNLAQIVPEEKSLFERSDACRFILIAVGHMKFQKGFDLLLKAVAQLQDLPLKLILIGSGDEENNLKNQVQDLGLAAKVVLLGHRRNPYSYMSRGDLFVLSSRWEGFGHVITEAMACGVPVLATRCPSGPDEIISDGVNGKLCDVNSVSALAENIRFLYNDEKLRKEFSRNAAETIRRFDAQKIASQYEEMFLSLI